MKDGKRPAEDGKSLWMKWNERQSKKQKKGSYAPRDDMKKARSSAASQEQLPEKKSEAPPPLTVYILEDPVKVAWYKLELTYKASFPLHKLRLPLVPLEDDAAKNHRFCIHGLQEVSVQYQELELGYKITEQKCRPVQRPRAQPVRYYRELMSKYWSCLGKKFDSDEAYYDYQNAKHNLGRYPKDMFLLNTMILGGGYIDLIDGIMKNLNYVVGPTRYNCLALLVI